MNNLEEFNFEGNNVRTVQIENEPYFVGKDVADILGYQNGSRDINRHVEEEDRQNYQNGTFESPRGLTVINESGLYSLILGSKLPNAKKFKRWVTHEVLPTIRQTGAYVTAKTAEDWLSNPDMMIATLERYKNAQAEIQQLHDENQQLKPKALFADAVATSHTSILVGDLAKILKQNGVETGAR
ncbi:BRO family protein, partial [Paucilactobacillus kaifaensis]|uniref:BRO family protein n=1 Tax=Paucilactobacillus kaifaensis TaxID=2559921 RepID=UPI0010F85ED3